MSDTKYNIVIKSLFRSLIMATPWARLRVSRTLELTRFRAAGAATRGTCNPRARTAHVIMPVFRDVFCLLFSCGRHGSKFDIFASSSSREKFDHLYREGMCLVQAFLCGAEITYPLEVQVIVCMRIHEMASSVDVQPILLMVTVVPMRTLRMSTLSLRPASSEEQLS